MQVSSTLIAVIAELYVALFIGVVILFLYARKLKGLLKKQQKKLLELINDPKGTQPPAARKAVAKPVAAPVPAMTAEPMAITTAPAPAPAPTGQNYKEYRHKMINATVTKYSLIAPSGNIETEQGPNAPLLQRILALRHAFLQAEEKGETEIAGTDRYWNIFEETLTSVLPDPHSPDQRGGVKEELENELDACRKRIEILENSKHLFFEFQTEWTLYQTRIQDCYDQLMALASELDKPDDFIKILQQIQEIYAEITQRVMQGNELARTTHHNPPSSVINPLDPDIASEIAKLREVASEQHRIIDQLQEKLVGATTIVAKELIIEELPQQLQQQTHFIRESETCVQSLADEFVRTQQELLQRETALNDQASMVAENQQMKEALHNFSLESKEILTSLDLVEAENIALKLKNDQTGISTPTL